MLVARMRDDAHVDELGAIGAGDLHLTAPEPGAELRSPPQRPAGGRGAGLSFDVALALGQHLHASEAHPDLGMLTEAQQARSHGAVAAAPAARCPWRLEMVGTNRGHRHAAKSPTVVALLVSGAPA